MVGTKDAKITESNVRKRAECIAWRYDLDEEEVMEALSKTHITIGDVIMNDFFIYLNFEPSLERALLLFRPKVALRLFLSGNLGDVTKLITFAEELVEMGILSDLFSIEALCRWEAEQYLLPD